jgi:hypothetical protein
VSYIKFVEVGCIEGGIRVEVYIGFGDDTLTGTLTLTLDQWNMLRDQEDDSPVVALTASEQHDVAATR